MKKQLAVIFALLAVAVGGCTQVPIVEGAQPSMRVQDSRAPNATMQMNRVVIIDRSLQTEESSKLAVERAGASSTPTGTMKVFATIRNRTTFPQQIEARVQFFDANQIPVEGPSPWQRIFLDAQSIGNYVTSSARADVAHYYVEIREAR